MSPRWRAFIRKRNLSATRDRPPVEVWQEGLADECAFWQTWFSTRGGEWPEDYRMRTDPGTPLQDRLAQHLPTGGGVPSILDVGAGPLTLIGKTWAQGPFTLRAVDALAAAYDEIMASVGVEPLVRSEQCDSEKLSAFFPDERFDLTFASNTLDHSYEPVRAIEQMLAVTKPGGIVRLEHHRNEAETEAYSGLHQWNFDERDGDGVVWRPGEQVSLRARFGAVSEVTAHTDASGLVTMLLTKHP